MKYAEQYSHHESFVLSRHGLHLLWRQCFLSRKDACGRIAERGPSRKCVKLYQLLLLIRCCSALPAPVPLYLLFWALKV